MKKITMLCLALGLFSQTYGQGFELGVKAGATATTGSSKLPSHSEPSGFPGVSIRTGEIDAKSDGMGFNFLAGIYGRVNIPLGFFIQGEIAYTQFTLKQKAENIKVYAESPLGSAPVDTIQSANVKSDLSGINIPILLGKTFAMKMVRVYIGPNFLIVTKAKQKITVSGENPIEDDLTKSPTPNDVSSGRPPLPDRAVNSLIIGLEAGVGVDIPKTGLGFDLRYSVPVITGVYKNKDISGFLGITSLSVSYKLFKVGK